MLPYKNKLGNRILYHRLSVSCSPLTEGCWNGVGKRAYLKINSNEVLLLQIKRHRITYIEIRAVFKVMCLIFSAVLGRKMTKTINIVRMCPFCRRVFSHGYYLERHLRTHTDERPFSCDICERAFHMKHHLTNHRRNVHKVVDKT